MIWPRKMLTTHLKKRRTNKMAKTERLYVRVTPELKEKIQKAAEEENRTISAWIETTLKSKFAEKDK